MCFSVKEMLFVKLTKNVKGPVRKINVNVWWKRIYTSIF